MDEAGPSSSAVVEDHNTTTTADNTTQRNTRNVALTGDALQFLPSAFNGKSVRPPSSKTSGAWGTNQKSFGFDAHVNDSYQDDDEDLTAWPVTANTSTPTPKHRKSKSISMVPVSSSSSSSVGGTSTVSLGVGRFRLGGRKQQSLRDFGSADAAEESIMGSSRQSHNIGVPFSASMTTTPEQQQQQQQQQTKQQAHSFLRKDFSRKTPTGAPTKKGAAWTTGRVGELPHKPSSVIVGDDGPSTVGRKPRNGKVARLASLFSSRAVVKNGSSGNNHHHSNNSGPFPKPSRGRSLTEDGPSPAGMRTEGKQLFPTNSMSDDHQLFPTNSMPDDHDMQEANEKQSM
eukprot:scaffold90998_cov32-Attheya_sp.AAC.1